MLDISGTMERRDGVVWAEDVQVCAATQTDLGVQSKIDLTRLELPRLERY